MASDSPVRVLAFAADEFACGQWRVIQPVRAMDDGRVAASISSGTHIDLESFDVAVFQRVLWPQQIRVLRALKQAGKKLIFDYDDAFPITDSTHREHATFAPGSVNSDALEQALALADAITVPTPQLVEHYRQMHRRVVLLPNAVDLAGPMFTNGPAEHVAPGLTVFWSGWTSHEENLRLIEPVITRLVRSRTDVYFALSGPTEFTAIFSALRGDQKMIHFPKMPYEPFMRIASVADVAIAPLTLTGFNQNKSEIRLIEAGIWGVPVVASPAAPYVRFEGGRGACLLAEGNSLDAWEHHLTRLLDDSALRRQVGRAARTAVESNYDLKQINVTRADLLCDV